MIRLLRCLCSTRFGLLTAIFFGLLTCITGWKLTLRPWLAGLEEQLETRFPPAQLDLDAQIAGIIVLGGGILRAQEAVSLAHSFPQSKIIASGVSNYEVEFLTKNLPTTGQLVVEARATNTFENALFAKRVAVPRSGDRWVLVTSALHMPRAIGTFSAQGFAVEPWPTYDCPGVHAVLHEFLGLLVYHVLGRTSSFFPSPQNPLRNSSETREPRVQTAILPSRRLPPSTKSCGG
jgi:uncharacterized SAM-binding protein YcdF (DUF218 family)